MSDTSFAAARGNSLYVTVWRWHFYAGLYVIPFLIMLATTGLIMLWVSSTTDLNGARTSVPTAGPMLAVSALQAAAEAAVPGSTAATYIAPRAQGRVALFLVTSDAATTAVLVDPHTAAVVDQFPSRAGWYDFASDIHGNLALGQWGDLAIEAAASLALMLVASGVYLHWPRNGARMFVPNLDARGRSWWKSLHGTVGLWISAMLVVFLVSGLSWSVIWGEKYVQAWSTFPAEKWDAVPLSDKTHATMNHAMTNAVPWALEQTPMPRSGSLAGTAAVAGPVTVDSVAGFARGLGFDGRFQIALPGDETGVWTISHDSMSNDGPKPWQDRTIHIDQYTGKVLADVGFADYSVYGRAMAVGIAFHEGDMGVWNLALNTAFCLSVIFVAVSGAVMWVVRRPARAGRLAAPPKPKATPLWVGAALIVGVLGIAFPMGGAVMLGVIVFDQTVLRLLPGVRRALS